MTMPITRGQPEVIASSPRSKSKEPWQSRVDVMPGVIIGKKPEPRARDHVTFDRLTFFQAFESESSSSSLDTFKQFCKQASEQKLV